MLHERIIRRDNFVWTYRDTGQHSVEMHSTESGQKTGQVV